MGDIDCLSKLFVDGDLSKLEEGLKEVEPFSIDKDNFVKLIKEVEKYFSGIRYGVLDAISSIGEWYNNREGANKEWRDLVLYAIGNEELSKGTTTYLAIVD